MAFRVLKSLLGKRQLADPEEIADVDQLIRRGAQRFATWASEQSGRPTPIAPESAAAVDKALERNRHSENSPHEIPQQLASDCASFIGEAIRAQHGGQWEEDDLLGLVLRRPGKIAGTAAVPLAIAEKKWELGDALKIARFFETLPQRLDKERENADYLAASPSSSTEIAKRLLAHDDPGAAAAHETKAFQAFWKERFRIALPLSLQGVRETERFLRSHFFLFALREETLVQMGFFLGEVGRGLFQGEWDLEEIRASNDPTRAALRWPELPYYPVGKIYKLLTERPESDSLDEYLRLIPSARNELRERK